MTVIIISVIIIIIIIIIMIMIIAIFGAFGHVKKGTINYIGKIPGNIRITSYRRQGLRLTFQLTSPVASAWLYSLAKTTFSLARYSNIHHRIKSSKCWPV